jgi:Cu(I)/Ag(I) efflux system membrane fusion protein
MKKTTTFVLSAVIAAGAFLAGTRYGGAPAPAPGGRKILYYTDPMHPAYRSDKPGIAPDCGMQLEPVYEDGAPAATAEAAPHRPAGAVAIALDKQQLLGVRVGAVERTSAVEPIRLFGRVAAEESRIYVLNAALEGSVRELSPVTTGSRVRKGQWLASMFEAEARGPLQALITAMDVQDQDPNARRQNGMIVAAGSNAAKSAQFSMERLRALGMDDLQIEEMRKTREVPTVLKVYAPADGFVVARNVSLGQKFEKNMEWFRIANLDKVWIVADAFENEARHLRPGMKAKVTLPGQPRAFTARVSEVLPQFDPASRTLKVRLEAENPGYALRPEMFVDVELSVELPEAVTVPHDALVDAGTKKTVFLAKGDGWFEPRRVETGWRFGDRVEIVRGLAAGDRIVVSGTFLVDSESQIRAAAAGVHGEPARDPVCGMEVDEAKARAAGKFVERDGKTQVFCSQDCKRKFEATASNHTRAAAAP